MLFHCLLTTRHCILVNLFLDHCFRIGENNSTILIAGWHFWLHTLHGWEEWCINWTRLWIVQFLCNISGHSKVRVLVNSRWDKTRYFIVRPKYMRERIRKCWHCLNRWISKFSYAIIILEAENSTNLTQSNMLLRFDYIWIHLLNIIWVTEDKCLFWIKSECNNILDIVVSHAKSLFPGLLFVVKVFLIISDLNDKGHVKCFL